MNVRELLEHIETFAPFTLAEEWDNPGLLVGSKNAEVKKIAAALDAVSEAVTVSADEGCNVLVCHHPLIFRPVSRVTDDTEQGRTIIEAIRRNVNIIALHTNWDNAEGGVNDTLASLLGLNDAERMDSFGVIGKLSVPMYRPAFAEHVKASWGLSHLDLYGQPARISRVALCGGAGAEFWREAKRRGADVYITADMKYHELSDAVNEGLSVALACHGEMERASLPALAEKLSQCGTETKIIDVKALPLPLRI